MFGLPTPAPRAKLLPAHELALLSRIIDLLQDKDPFSDSHLRLGGDAPQLGRGANLRRLG